MWDTMLQKWLYVDPEPAYTEMTGKYPESYTG